MNVQLFRDGLVDPLQETQELLMPVLPMAGADDFARGYMQSHKQRRGPMALFAALELKISHMIGQLNRRHRSPEFRKFLDLIEARVPAELEIHTIMDNYGTHKTAIIRKWFAKRPRFHVHFAPT